MVRLPGRFTSQLTTHTTRQINISNQRENEHRAYNPTAEHCCSCSYGILLFIEKYSIEMKSAHFKHIFINESLFCCCWKYVAALKLFTLK